MKKKIRLLSKQQPQEPEKISPPARVGKLGKEKGRPLSINARRFAVLLSENIGKVEGGKVTIQSLMERAGYSPTTAKQQKLIVDRVRESGVLDPIVAKMDERIGWALDAMTEKKIKKQSPYTNALTSDLLVKNKQLLSGKPTGIDAMQLTDEQFDKLKERAAKKAK